MACTLQVPQFPLTAQGLATPYVQSSNCPMSTLGTFVQGAILDLDKGSIAIYNPLVITSGTVPAVVPTVPVLPVHSVVAVWIGSNANTVQLIGAGLANANCVNGNVEGTVFGQVAACGADDFFNQANLLIAAGKLIVPSPGVANNGKPCPSVRDFSIIDQDQSDNVNTQYLLLPNGQTAQYSVANAKKLPNAIVLDNGSDNFLISNFVFPALNCKSFKAPNLADNGTLVAALPLNELQAAAFPAIPSIDIALVPENDPMVMVNGAFNLAKLNQYRSIVNQHFVSKLGAASGLAYCRGFVRAGIPRLAAEYNAFTSQPTVNADVGTNLATFLANRAQATFVNLGCATLLKIANPVTLVNNANGVTTNATYNLIASNEFAAADYVVVAPAATSVGLSSGAIAGIVLAVLFVLFIFALYLLYEYRKDQYESCFFSLKSCCTCLYPQAVSQKVSFPRERASLSALAVEMDSKVQSHPTSVVQAQMSAYSASEALPPGWQKYKDDDGREYYFNNSTQVSTWLKPT